MKPLKPLPVLRRLSAVTLVAILLLAPIHLWPAQGNQPAALGSGPSLTPSPTPPMGESPAIHLAYFSKAGCPACAKVDTHLDELQRRYPQVRN